MKGGAFINKTKKVSGPGLDAFLHTENIYQK